MPTENVIRDTLLATRRFSSLERAFYVELEGSNEWAKMMVEDRDCLAEWGVNLKVICYVRPSRVLKTEEDVAKRLYYCAAKGAEISFRIMDGEITEDEGVDMLGKVANGADCDGRDQE